MKYLVKERGKEIIWDTKGRICGDDEASIVLKIDYWGAFLSIEGRDFSMGLVVPDESLLKLKEALEQLKVVRFVPVCCIKCGRRLFFERVEENFKDDKILTTCTECLQRR